LGKNGDLVGFPYNYRDERVSGVMEEAFKTLSKEKIFDITGLAFLNFNTLYQLIAQKRDNPKLLDAADTFLMMADLFAYFLTGVKKAEYTNATTSQLLDARTGTWSKELLDTFGIPTHIFPEIQQPGVIRGTLLPKLAKELGLPEVPVVAVATHDTGSAVAAVPTMGGHYAYISSGTWSLMGIESKTPFTSKAVMDANITNEGGIEGNKRVLKNIMGLWIVQECKREWDRRGEVLGFGELVELAEVCEPFRSIVEPDDGDFYFPGDMPEKIQNFCRRTNQPVPETKGQIMRCVYESLALKYRWTLERLEELSGHKVDALHIVGGGTQNKLLNQFVANAIQQPVICGPVEATAIGNMLMQAVALGALKDQAAGRQVVKDSFPTEDFLPQAGSKAQWDAAYEKFLTFMG